MKRYVILQNTKEDPTLFTIPEEYKNATIITAFNIGKILDKNSCIIMGDSVAIFKAKYPSNNEYTAVIEFPTP